MSSTRHNRREALMGPLLTLVLCFIFNYSTPVEAYLDPGSGSMMLQLLLGGVAGIAVVFKLYWRRLSERLRFKSTSRKKSA
jgi:hypothetical protein